MPDLPSNPQAALIVRDLQLAPHPEGGWYREILRAPADETGRSARTSIHFLLCAGERSQWHRVDVSETWRWSDGAPLELALFRDGLREAHIIGPASEPEYEIPPGVWQSAVSTGAWTLVGCDCRPGFEFSGFELAPPGRDPDAA
jgi:predicted cupin superfamily sugar epimerase